MPARMLGALLVGLLAQSPPPMVTADPEQVSTAYLRPVHFSRLGLAALAGVGLGPGAATLHGRIGPRLSLLERTHSGSGVNVAVALLGGGGKGQSGATLGLDLRIELLYLGNKVEALQPIGNLYFTGGIVAPIERRAAIGYHVGAGIGFDLMFSGVLGDSGGLWGAVASSGEAGVFVAAIILLVTSPTLEGRYTMRSDGSGFGSLVFGVGI